MPKKTPNKKPSTTIAKNTLAPAYKGSKGSCFNSSIEEFLESNEAKKLQGKVQLIFTSPPFPLASPKAYGNLEGEEYLNWLVEIVQRLTSLLKPDGSLVMEIGNCWDKGTPTMSTLPLKTLIAIAEKANLNVCQQFVWENSARLPGPATWVNKRRIRIKDSHTHIWWFSPSEFPKADNRNILTAYSKAMERLIKTGKYNPGVRPSEHVISDKYFAINNQGAIPGSTLVLGNTSQDPNYVRWCKEQEIKMHPARMPIKLAEFFIKFLTDENDLVLDPFGGSNTTGQAAENLKRKWVTIERDESYVKGSHGRFKTS